MTNGDLIRKVFPLITDSDIGHIAATNLACYRCPLEGDIARCSGTNGSCDNAIYNYMKEEAKIDA